MATLFRTAVSTANRTMTNVTSSSLFVRSMATGSTKWFNVKKGYGFIAPDEAGASEVFVHQTAIQGQGFRYLKEGEKVTYEVEASSRGPQAKNVRDATGNPFKRVQMPRAPRPEGAAPKSETPKAQ